jgi:hypothetical protein
MRKYKAHISRMVGQMLGLNPDYIYPMLKVHNGDISLPCFELARLAGADPVGQRYG